MSVQELEAAITRLSKEELTTFSQWFEEYVADTEERDAVREAIRRDEELSSGTVVGRTHDEVMQAARGAIGCADWRYRLPD